VGPLGPRAHATGRGPEGPHHTMTMGRGPRAGGRCDEGPRHRHRVSVSRSSTGPDIGPGPACLTPKGQKAEGQFQRLRPRGLLLCGLCVCKGYRDKVRYQERHRLHLSCVELQRSVRVPLCQPAVAQGGCARLLASAAPPSWPALAAAALDCGCIHCTTPCYAALHCTALHSLRCTTLVALHCLALALHCAALHCTRCAALPSLHYYTLHYFALHRWRPLARALVGLGRELDAPHRRASLALVPGPRRPGLTAFERPGPVKGSGCGRRAT